MNNRDEAKLNMYNAVAAFCQANNATLSAMPALAAAITSFNSSLQVLKDAAAEEAQIITGITQNKANLKKTLCETTAAHAAVLFAYAMAQNNEELKAKARLSFTDLFKLKDEELGLAAQNLSDELTASAAALADYGITAGIITSFNSMITQYQAAIPSPRNASSQRKTFARQMKTQFKEVDTVLKLQVDKLMLPFKKTNTNLFNEYQSNRVIVNAPVSSTRLAGTVMNGSAALSSVSVQVIDTVYNTSSNAAGKYAAKIPVPGVYTVSFSKPGYLTKTISNVAITLGQTTTLNTTLELNP